MQPDATSVVAMQRLFANFSGGKPGVGLAVLRGALGLAVWASTRHAWRGDAVLLEWASLASLALIVLLVAGCLTRFASVGCALMPVCALAASASTQPTLTVLVVMLALALFLLGPGEYSVDAWRFGRRVIELPSSRSPARNSIHPDG